MPLHEIELLAVVRALGDGTMLAEALFYPEVSRYGDDAQKVLQSVEKNAALLLERRGALAAAARRRVCDMANARINDPTLDKSFAWTHADSFIAERRAEGLIDALGSILNKQHARRAESLIES
jgi:hypothetical protein